MRKIALVVIAVLVGLASNSVVLAQGTGAPSTEPKVSKVDRMAKALNLTDPQKQQVQAILDKAKTDAAGVSNPQARRQIHKAAWKDIRTNVLTDQQRQQLAQMHRHHHRGMKVLRTLNLTPEQKAQAKEIFQQARSDAASTTDPQARKDIRKQAWQKVRTEVLTDAQRQQLDQMKAQWKAKHAPATSPS